MRDGRQRQEREAVGKRRGIRRGQVAGDMFGRMCRLAGLLLLPLLLKFCIVHLTMCATKQTETETETHRQRGTACACVCVCARHCPTAAAAAVGTSRFGIYMTRP